MLLLAGLSQGWGGETNSAAAQQLADVPANSVWFAHLDCERLRASATGRLLRAQSGNPAVEQAIASFAAGAGFDPRTAIRALTAYGAGLAGDDPVLIVHGDFDPDRLIALARTLPDYQAIGEAPRLIHHWQNAPNAPARTYAAISARNVVIFGRKPAAVLAALDVLEHKTPSLAASAGAPALAAEAGPNIVAAGVLKPGLQMAPPLDGLARLAKSAILTIREEQAKVIGTLLLEADDVPTATQLVNLGRGLIALMKLNASKPESVKLAEALGVSQDGPRVEVSLVMKPEDVASGIVKAVAKNFIPPPPRFPCFTDRDAIIAEAQAISDRLKAHIKAWLDGQAPAPCISKLLVILLDYQVPAVTESGRGHGNRATRTPDIGDGDGLVSGLD